MTCPICTSDQTHTVDLLMYLQNSNDSYPVSLCNRCHSYYFNPLPTTSALEAHYSDSYNFYQGGNPKQLGRGAGFSKTYLLQHREHGTLLDVGCGAADFLVGIESQSSWTTTGLDINKKSVQEASDRTGIEIIHGDIFTNDLNNRTFDCIHLRDVIEHVPDPVKFMKRACELLSPNGFIYVRIPNGTNEIKPKIRLFKKNQSPVLTTPGHIFYISKDGFKQLIQRTGLQIKSSKSFGLKNGLRNLGLFLIPKHSRKASSKPSSQLINSKNSDFQHKASKAEKRFMRQEKSLKKGASIFYLEHVYILKKCADK